MTFEEYESINYIPFCDKKNPRAINNILHNYFKIRLKIAYLIQSDAHI